MNWILTHTDFTTPAMFVAAILAVAFVGLAKGGLAGFGLLGVPILALYMPPLQAAALLLPSYLIMDATALITWRHYKDWSVIRDMLPAAIVGIIIGAALASVTSDNAVKLIVGIITVIFVLRQSYLAYHRRVEPAKPNRSKARVWGAISGFTSFIAHAGGPPFQVYTLPLRLDPKMLTGTATIFFAIVNSIKVIPYFVLGQFTDKTLASTVILIPVTIAFVLIGAAIVKRMSERVFYPLAYLMAFIVALKLIADGVQGL